MALVQLNYNPHPVLLDCAAPSALQKELKKSNDVFALTINNSTPDVVKGLLLAIRDCGRVKELTFKNCELTDRNIQDIQSLIEECSALTSLDLEGNRIGCEGVTVVASILDNLQGVIHLNLGNNRLDNEAAKALVKSEHLPNLQALDLSNNRIRSEGSAALYWVLSPNKTIMVNFGGNTGSVKGEVAMNFFQRLLNEPGIVTFDDGSPFHQASVFQEYYPLIQERGINKIVFPPKWDDNASMTVFYTIHQGNQDENHDIDCNIDFDFSGNDKCRINSWETFQEAVLRFRPSSLLQTPGDKAMFLLQGLLFFGDVSSDIVNIFEAYALNWKFGVIMLCICGLPALLAMIQEGIRPRKGPLECAKQFFGTITLIIPLRAFVRSWMKQEEGQDYIRATTRQAMWESVLQSWFVFFLYLYEKKMQCQSAPQNCFFETNRQEVLLIAGFASSLFATAYTLSSLRLAQGKTTTRKTMELKTKLRLMAPFWFVFFMESTARMMTAAMLWLILGRYSFVALVAIYFVRGYFVYTTPKSPFAPTAVCDERLTSDNVAFLFIRSAETVVSTYFARTSRKLNAILSIMTLLENGTVTLCFALIAQDHLPHELRNTLLVTTGVCSVLTFVWQLMRNDFVSSNATADSKRLP